MKSDVLINAAGIESETVSSSAAISTLTPKANSTLSITSGVVCSSRDNPIVSSSM
ncbi:unannotated protein [freshwater metagenome]|uniref:Unannotated protein n=1 Tax=freshwater metagenome TaxID=449393 RepID=A0A6J7E0U5_9ZZZZ